MTFKVQQLLSWALERGFSELYLPLIRAGASPDTPDRFGDTALIYTANTGDMKSFKELLALKANPNVQNEDGESAIHIAASDGNFPMLQALLRAGGKGPIRKTIKRL